MECYQLAESLIGTQRLWSKHCGGLIIWKDGIPDELILKENQIKVDKYDVEENNWYIDNRFLKREKINKQLFISLSSGDHIISCVDDKGRTSTVKITIKYAL